MTVKRDFKRRVRLRQTRTGESYVTARRRLLANRPGPASDGDDPDADGATAVGGDVQVEPAPAGASSGTSAISVIEVIDVSEEARRAGLSCRAVMFPALADRVAPARVLRRLCDVLIATAGDPAMARLSRLALTAQILPRRRHEVFDVTSLRLFLERARAGLGGTLGDGATLAFHVAEGDDLIPIMCTLSAAGTAIELSVIGGPLPERWAPFASVLGPLRAELSDVERRRELAAALAGEIWHVGQLARNRLPEPTLYVVHAGRRCAVNREPFLIGRSPGVCDLVLDHADVSPEHAAVVASGRSYHIKDLGSAHGILYKGMQIDNKRIVEGDVVEIAGHEVRFTFHAD